LSLVQGIGDFRRLSAYPAFVGAVLSATGLVVWIGLSVWGGMDGEAGLRLREAWDTPGYFTFGVPVMAAAVGLAAFHMPRRPWRWPLWLVAGHQLGVLLVGLGMQSGLSLILLTAILAILLAVIFAVPAMVGSLVGRRIRMRAY
jgi:hypothetical protein